MRVSVLIVALLSTAACASTPKSTAPPPRPQGAYRFRVAGDGIRRVIEGRVHFVGDSVDFQADGCTPRDLERDQQTRLGGPSNRDYLVCGSETSVWLTYNSNRWRVGYTTQMTVRRRKDVCLSTQIQNGREVCTRMGAEYDDHDVPVTGAVELIPDK